MDLKYKKRFLSEINEFYFTKSNLRLPNQRNRMATIKGRDVERKLAPEE